MNTFDFQNSVHSNSTLLDSSKNAGSDSGSNAEEDIIFSVLSEYPEKTKEELTDEPPEKGLGLTNDELQSTHKQLMFSEYALTHLPQQLAMR